MKLLLNSKLAIITGANQGLGLEISRKYIQAGASIIMCARDINLLRKAHNELVNELQTSTQIIETISIDVSDAKGVEDLVSNISQKFGKIDILVNNAGVYGPMGAIEENDWANWIKTIEINLFGSVLMCKEVLSQMKKQRNGKIIQLSGGGATNPMPYISAYATSKAAIIRFIETIALEVLDYNIDVNAIAPGALNTRMLDEVLIAGPEKVGQSFFDRAIKQKETGGAGFDKAAELCVFLGSELSDGITGKLISAIWDNWQEWPNYKEKLINSDVYTLRRIVGKDRNFSIGDK